MDDANEARSRGGGIITTTEAEYRTRAARGEFLTEGETQLLRGAEQLLHPVALRHWDLAQCFCPLCAMWTAASRALLAIEQEGG